MLENLDIENIEIDLGQRKDRESEIHKSIRDKFNDDIEKLLSEDEDQTSLQSLDLSKDRKFSQDMSKEVLASDLLKMPADLDLSLPEMPLKKLGS